MTPAVATVDTSLRSPPTLLGNASIRIPTAGRIRAGIKVLTRRAAEHPRARELYDRGVAAGLSFDEIERRIAEGVPELKHPLVPKNVPYFTVRSADFPNPETPRQILEAFGEDRGDGAQRLYRFPVVFPSDAWQSVMPHELVAHTANERRYWSEYAEDGLTRYCKCHAPVPMDPGGRRSIRLFGGRKTMLRERNGGLCEPESCPEYQGRRCNLSGRFVFFIPGIASISAFELGTNSFYAMEGAIRKFRTIAFLRGGRISGFLDGRRTPFYLTKRLLEVPRIDEAGRAVRVAQWIIDLEAPIDVTALLQSADERPAFAARGDAAVSVLEGPQRWRTAAGAPEVVEPASARQAPEHLNSPASNPATLPDAPSESPDSDTAGPEDRPRPTGGVHDMEAALALAEHCGVPRDRYLAFADKRWGPGWKLSEHGRRRALQALRRVADDPEGFRARVDAEIDAFT